MSDPPILINVRDRVTSLRALVKWLEAAGHERLVLIDNASTYEPLLDYLDESPHEVIRLGVNHGSRALWIAGLVPSEPFVYTDPDVIPTADCPADAVDHLADLLNRYPSFQKAGLGLYLEDVPESLPSLEWERSLVSPDRELEPGVFGSLIDTTFALYRPGARFDYHAIRCGAPYTARHTSWYVDEPNGEDTYYLAHAMPGPLGSSWKDGKQ